MSIEVTVGDIENILLAHKTFLPHDVIEKLLFVLFDFGQSVNQKRTYMFVL